MLALALQAARWLRDEEAAGSQPGDKEALDRSSSGATPGATRADDMTTARAESKRPLPPGLLLRTVLDTLGQLMGAYGSEGWGCESLRARYLRKRQTSGKPCSC